MHESHGCTPILKAMLRWYLTLCLADAEIYAVANLNGPCSAEKREESPHIHESIRSGAEWSSGLQKKPSPAAAVVVVAVRHSKTRSSAIRQIKHISIISNPANSGQSRGSIFGFTFSGVGSSGDHRRLASAWLTYYGRILILKYDKHLL